MWSKKGIGRSCGGITSKIHAITDSLGQPQKYDKLAVTYMAFVYIVASVLWIK